MSDRRLALVVAIDQYDQPALHQLAAPGADAEALAEVLGDPELGGFEVEVLRNPASSTLAERVERTLTGRHPSDLVLLHFSCHGLKDDAGELHLAATNTVPELLGSTAVDAAWVSRVMQRSRAQRVVLLLDCCYGGAFERGLMRRAGSDVDVGDQFSQRQLGEGRGRVVITASTAMEYAFEDAELAGGAAIRPSVFTGALVDGIRSGEADRNQDGQVSLGELYDFVYDRVRARTPKQTPSKWEFGVRGDLYVARNPNRRVRPAALAPELLDLAKHSLPGGRSAAVHELARIAAGADLDRAAAARGQLQELSEDDSRAVSAEATAALVETGTRLAAETLDLGSVRIGGPPATATVTVLGGPLAQASEVVAGDSLRARLDGSMLHVTWVPRVAGDLNEPVTLNGPAGSAELRVLGRATASPPRPAPMPGPALGPALNEPAKRNSAALAAAAAVLVLTGGIAFAAIAANDGEKGGSAAKSAGTPTAAVSASTAPSSAAPSSAPTSPPPSPTAKPSNYEVLLTRLPGSIKAGCTQQKPAYGELASASCPPGVFLLWPSIAKLKSDFDSGASPRKGSCAKPPADTHRIDDKFPQNRAGQLACWLFPKTADNPKAYYAIEWAVHGHLVTGTFTTEDTDPEDYAQLHADALLALMQMP